MLLLARLLSLGGVVYVAAWAGLVSPAAVERESERRSRRGGHRDGGAGYWPYRALSTECAAVRPWGAEPLGGSARGGASRTALLFGDEKLIGGEPSTRFAGLITVYRGTLDGLCL